MANMRISWPNRFAQAAIAGATGDWATNLPASNVKTTAIAQVARSASAAAAIWMARGSMSMP